MEDKQFVRSRGLLSLGRLLPVIPLSRWLVVRKGGSF